jgi:sugar phosphate isomerase/epimerase
MTTVALSTAFNINSVKSWKKLVADTKKLGFSAMELNVEIPAAWMPEAAASVENGEIVVTSLHNYCPRIENLPSGRSVYSGYLLTSDNEEERKLAVEHTRNTIAWAGKLGAKAVVVHAGEIPTEPSAREFYRYLQQFGRDGKLVHQYLSTLLSDRKSKSNRYLETLMKGLDELLPLAAQAKVFVCLENRFYIHEVPNIEEAERLLGVYKKSPLGYWHDTGHAEVFVRHKWTPRHQDYLDVLGDRLVGLHLHDLRRFSDHYAPGSGDFDFSILKPYLNEKHLRVVEAHPKSNRKEVQQSLEFMKKTGLI